MGLSVQEQETNISFGRDDGRAKVYTSDTTVMTKLNKFIDLPNAEWKLESESTIKGEVVGITYSCPVNLISFRKKTVTRELTEEQRKEMGERMRSNRN